MHTGIGAIRAPLLRNSQEGFAKGFFVRAVQLIDMDHGILDPPVIDRKDVFPSEPKHQQHLNCPPAYSLDPGKMCDDCLVIHLMKNLIIKAMFKGKTCHVLNITHFCVGQTDRPKGLRSGSKYFIGQGNTSVIKSQKTVSDRVSHFGGKLLAHDGGNEVKENVFTSAHSEGFDALDE